MTLQPAAQPWPNPVPAAAPAPVPPTPPAAPSGQDIAKEHAAFRARIVRSTGEPVARYFEINRDLIIDMHHANVGRSEMAHILGIGRIGQFERALNVTKLTRSALGLPKLPGNGPAARRHEKMRIWTPFEDFHVRRGFTCGILVESIGAIISRSGDEVLARARDLKLGEDGSGLWTFQPCARLRGIAQRAFDAAHQIIGSHVSEFRQE